MNNAEVLIAALRDEQVLDLLWQTKRTRRRLLGFRINSSMQFTKRAEVLALVRAEMAKRMLVESR